MKKSLVEREALERWLERFPEWRSAGGGIERRLRFGGFREAIAFVNVLANWAEEVNHHPDLSVSYRIVMVSLTTHDSSGVTALDLELAERIEKYFDAQ